MKNKDCIAVKELLPLYIENVIGTDAAGLVEEHLKICPDCNLAYSEMKKDFHIIMKTDEPDKHTVCHINGIKIWYLLCPLIPLVLSLYEWYPVLRAYEAYLILFSAICILSELLHKKPWWDTENLKQQGELHGRSPKKIKQFYTRPVFLAFPSILVILILEFPRITGIVGIL